MVLVHCAGTQWYEIVITRQCSKPSNDTRAQRCCWASPLHARPTATLFSRDCICLIIPPVAAPPLCFLPLLCAIVCCDAQLGRPGQSLSAFSCSEGNQLWQSCKLFLLGAKGAGAHAHSRPPCLYQGPVGSYGPFIRQA